MPSNGVDSTTTGVADPLDSSPANLDSVDQLDIDMDDNDGGYVMDSQPYVWHPTDPSGIMVFVHVGHTDDWEDAGVGDAIRALVEDDFTVVGFLMPADGDAAVHNTYTNHGDLNYMKFFVEPVVRVLNEYESSYDDFYMVGMSGGGWTTVLSTALDTRITRSVDVAGSYPLYIEVGGLGGRDWEQRLPGLNGTLDYQDLYVMCTDGGREHEQINTENDSCCFTLAQYNSEPPYESAVSTQATALGGSFDLVWDDTHAGHQISAFALAEIQTVFA